jgi:drug/metabolite transporter (DMT)-like permease
MVAVPGANPGGGLAPAAVHRPPATDVALMTLAVGAVSTSGPLIAATAAPALAIAFWRNAMAVGVLTPWTLWRARPELRRLRRRDLRVLVVAGVLLFAHFATWVPSVTLTSVAAATALVATQPVWAALIARRRGQQIPGRAWLGIGVAVAGAAVVTGVDVTVSTRAFEGDLLALVGGVFAAAYVTAGGVARQNVTTTVYTTVCYATAAVFLLAACLVGGMRLTGYPTSAWLKLAGITVGPQLLGHSVFNRVLRTTSATVVSMAILFEVPGAALIAGFALHQHPQALLIPGLVLLLVGVAIVVSSRPAPGPPVD